jgi:glycosyltransferase involved in cell wall biosynthesis
MVSASPLDHWERQGLPNARFVQTSDFDEVRSYIASATVAALPRTVCTGYPIKLLNSLGMGLVTVAAAGSARPLPGVVSVPNHDAGAMAREIRRLVEAPQRCRELGEKARAHVLTHCTWAARARELEAVYRAVLTSIS